MRLVRCHADLVKAAPRVETRGMRIASALIPVPYASGFQPEVLNNTPHRIIVAMWPRDGSSALDRRATVRS